MTGIFVPKRAEASPQSIAIWGGTFDPIHQGHVRLAQALKLSLGFDRMLLMPACIPPHKERPGVAPAQRAAMVELALAETGLEIDRRELDRDGPCYTVESLAEIRQQLGANTKLSFCMGMDSLVNLHHWYQWRQLFNLAHIVVAARPQWQVEQIDFSPLKTELQQRLLAPAKFKQSQAAAGHIVLCQTQMLEFSSTEIRQKLGAGQAAGTIESLNPAVAEYIQDQGLYC